MSRLYLAVTCKSMVVVGFCCQYSALRKRRLKGRPLNHPPPYRGDAYPTEVFRRAGSERKSALGLNKANRQLINTNSYFYLLRASHKSSALFFLGNCKFDQKIMLLFWLAPLKLQSLLRWGYHGFHYS